MAAEAPGQLAQTTPYRFGMLPFEELLVLGHCERSDTNMQLNWVSEPEEY